MNIPPPPSINQDSEQPGLSPSPENLPLGGPEPGGNFESDDESSDFSSTPRSVSYRKLAFIVLALLIVGKLFWPEFPITHAEGVLIPEEPWQGPPSIDTVWAHEGFTFTSLAEIAMEARVLSKKRYRYGTEAEISKYDLALGWGPVSDQWLVDQLKFSQSGRWYYFRFRNPPPVSPNTVLNNSGNFHTVASTDEILDTIADLRPGHLIYLKGQLVRINDNSGWNWQSSVSRTDRGNGSCELVWIEEISIRND